VTQPTGGGAESVEEDGPGRPPARKRGRAEPRSWATEGNTLEGNPRELIAGSSKDTVEPRTGNEALKGTSVRALERGPGNSRKAGTGQPAPIRAG
jgi:hypothetical protein